MSQTSITPKNTITAVTGTNGTVFDAAGRVFDTPKNSILTWYQKSDANVPLSWVALRTSGGMYEKGQTRGWSSKTTHETPVMETLLDSSANGYQAQAKVAGRTIFTLSVNRTALMTQGVAIQSLVEFAYMLLTDTKLQQQIVGYTPADS